MGGRLLALERTDLCAAGEIPRSALAGHEQEWSLERLGGQFIELTGGPAAAISTAAAGLILEAQRRGEPAAWIAARPSMVYPPDLAAWGIDLAALPVVRAPDLAKALRAADALLRSGGFALIVLDLGRTERLPLHVQSRLMSLAKKHHTTVACLTRTRPGGAALGSLVSLRGEIERRRTGFDRFVCELRAVKDKRLKPGWSHSMVCRGTEGLC